MGIICGNNKKEFWKILKEGTLECNGEIGVEIQTGEWNDWNSDGVITVFMNKKVYEKIINNEYYFKSQPYSDIPIRVFNKDNQEIDLLYDKPLI